MDYVQEMLLNQKELLALLMLGSSGSEELFQDVEEEPVVRQATTGERSAEMTAAKEYQTGLDGRQKNGSVASSREQILSGQFRKATGSGTEKGVRTAAPSGTYGSVEVWDSLAASGSLESSFTGAKEMSRAIQRDARRYDGGFSIY